MMRAKVVVRFYDKEKKALHEVGDIIEITDKRFEEINSASYRVFVEAIEEGSYMDYAMKYPLTEEYLNSHTKKELVSMAEDKGVEVTSKMTKAMIIEELMK